MVGNYFDAQDMTQETFLSYYRAMDKFDGKNEKAFLTKIAINKCIDLQKRASQREKPSGDDVLEHYAPTVPPPEETILEEEVKKELQQACQSLRPPYCRIAYEYYCRGQTAAEIAEAEGKKLKTVQTQIARSRKMLQKILKR